MQAKLAAATLATLFILYSFAAAQDYCIRANRGLNLREAASLRSNVAGTVFSGETLLVTGESNSWLRISRNSREVWLANWVNYSRLDDCGGTAPQPATGAAAAETDNCCFVDRQCHTDQEWIDGYWAYQNNECQAPAQSQTPGSSQPVSVGPAPIDNCCFVDRQCHSDMDWINGYHAYQNNQCAAPGQTAAISQPDGGVILRAASGIVIGYTGGHSRLPSTSYTRRPALGETISFVNCCELTWQCNSDQDWAEGYQAFQNSSCALPGLISIVGDADFVAQFERALDLLRTRLPHRYHYVLDGMDKIEELDGVGTGILATQRIFKVRRDGHLGVPSSPREELMASVLAHEACHVHRHNAGYRIRNRCDREGFNREEAACEEQELGVLIDLGVEQHWIDSQRDLIARIRSGEFNVFNDSC